MKLKLDDSGNVVVENGMPVYVDGAGKDIVFDAPATLFKVKSLTEEKDRHFGKASDLQKKLDEAQTSLQAFDGLDVDAAKLAIETVEKMEGGKMIEAGEFDKLKTQMQGIQDKALSEQKETYEAKLAENETNIAGQQKTINNLMISSNFAKSPFFSGDKPRTILTPDLAANLFRTNFKVEGDGPEPQLIGYLNGEKIPSSTNVGEPADFEEAISVIIEKHPGKERFLSSPEGGGPGAGSNFGRDGGSVMISEADASDPQTYRAAKVKAEKLGVPIQVID